MRDAQAILVVHDPLPRHTRGEELVHALSHALGLVASLIGFGVLMTAAWFRGEPHHVIGCGIFGVTLVACYAASTLYHAWPEPSVKRHLLLVDCTAIYLLIAGTYTPFLLASSHDASAAVLLILVWTLAALGIGVELLLRGTRERVRVCLCLFMGGLMIFAVGPVAQAIDPVGLTLLVVGVVLYGSGVVFFLWDQLPYNHVVWHGFVLAGSGLHYASVLGYVVP